MEDGKVSYRSSSINRARALSGAGWMLLFALLLTIVVTIPAEAAQPEISIRRTDVSKYPLISLTATVANGDQGRLPALSQKHFVLRENDTVISKLKVKHIAQKTEPVAVVLVLDVSGSMKGQPLESAKAAATAFLELMKPHDMVGVVAFGSEPQIVSELSTDKEALKGAIDNLRPQGETALYDGLIAGLSMFSGATSQGTWHKNIVVLSDGGDTTSTNSIDTVQALAQETGVPVYSVGLQSPEFDPGTIQRISEASGGKLLLTSDPGAFGALYAQLAKEFHTQYLITYESRGSEAKVLKIKLEMTVFGATSVSRTVISNPEQFVGQDSEARTQPKESAKPIRQPPASLLLIVSVLFSFLAVLLLTMTVMSFFGGTGDNLKRQMNFYDTVWKRMREREAGDLQEPAEEVSAQGKKKYLERAFRATDYVANKRGFQELIGKKLERAGLPLRPVEFILFHFLFTVILTFAGSALAKGASTVFAGMIIGAAFGVMAPLLFLQVLADIRKARFHEQLPNTLNMISGAMRAGYGLVQALTVAAKESWPPMSSELQRTLAEARLGLPLEESLQKMAERVGEDNFTWTVMAINIQREVGGNLAQLLEIIADTIRARDKIKRQIKTLTAEGRLSALILSILPVGMAFVFFILNPSYMLLLVTTAIGLGMVAVALLLFVIGVMWLRKIVTIEV